MIATPDQAVSRAPRLGRSITRALAVAFLLSIPLVSFPWFPSGLGSIISPASLYFLVPLLVLSFAAATVRRRWRKSHLVWGIWVLFPVIISGLPLLLYTYPAPEGQVVFRYARAGLSIAFAVSFYLAGHYLATSLPNSSRFIVRVLNFGLVLALGIGLLGALTIIRTPLITELYIMLRELTTVSGSNVIGGLNRLAALTFEPSFAGLEYTVWWLPFSIAAFVTLRKRRYLVASLALAVFALLSFSLTGLVGLFGLLLVLVWLGRYRRLIRLLVTLVVIGASLALPLAPLLGFDQGAVALQRISQEWERLEQGDLQRSGPSDGSLAVRSALTHTALNVWLATPLTGAGLGVAGYLFAHHVPAWVYVNPYMEEYWRYVLDPDAGRVFPSAKNFYLRVLSEMGLVGLIVVIGLGFAIVSRLFKAWRTLKSTSTNGAAHAHASLLLLASLLSSGAMAFCYLSVDSFAFPFLWVWWGLGIGLTHQLRS